MDASTHDMDRAEAALGLPRIECVECPLHRAMEELADATVKQYVLYLEGECLPRPEFLRNLERWSSLHELIRTRICVASRVRTLPPADISSVLDGLLAQPPDAVVSSRWRSLRSTLAACATADSCPLGIATPSEHR